jgi:hypothetical protein
MKYFYKIQNNKAVLGSGTKLPDTSFKVYIKGQEPQELLDILKEQEFSKALACKLKELETNYNSSIQQNIDYLDTTFQADKASQDLIASNLSVGSVPDGFYWQDINNEKVPMSYEDLQGLASAIQTRGLVSFGKLQELKALVKEAATVEELEEILWEE